MAKFKPARRASFGPVRRFNRLNSYVRITFAVLLGVLVISLFRRGQGHTPRPEQPLEQPLEAPPQPAIQFPANLEKQIREHCRDLEVLQNLDECVTNSNFKRRPNSDSVANEFDADDSPVSLESQYGLVLSYGVRYDASGNRRKLSERYHQTISMKCAIGSGMSVAWDMEFDDKWIHSLDFGVYESEKLPKAASRPGSVSCVELGRESAASMAIYLNCGFDIEKDSWGNPLGEDDHEAVESCVRQSFIWLNNTDAAIEGIEPWNALCTQSADGHLNCRKDAFELDKAQARLGLDRLS